MLLKLSFACILLSLAVNADNKNEKNQNITVKAINSPVNDGKAKFTLELPINFNPRVVEFKIESQLKIKPAAKLKEQKTTLIQQPDKKWLAEINVVAFMPGDFKIEFEVKEKKSVAQICVEFFKYLFRRGPPPRNIEYRGNTTFAVSNALEVPDPGEAGMLTLAGIDSDNDGIRDDVQRWILQNYGTSEKTVMALKQYAKLQQIGLLNIDDRQKSVQNVYKEIESFDCLEYIFNSLDLASEARKKMQVVYLNTDERIRADIKINANFNGHSVSSKNDKGKLGCAFDPDLLSN